MISFKPRVGKAKTGLTSGGFTVIIPSFNIMIYGYCLENKFSDALGLVNKMSEFGCLPDNVSYNTILDVFCKKGRSNEARDLLLDMKNRGLLLNWNGTRIIFWFVGIVRWGG